LKTSQKILTNLSFFGLVCVGTTIGISAPVTALATGSETLKGAQKDYESFKSEMFVKLNTAEQKLNELRGQAAHTGDDVGQKTAAELEKSRVELQDQLDHAQQTSTSTWKRFKNNFAESVDQLNSKVQKAFRSK
jgi:F0F1-type ATP synthase membrane subunit b/b'